MVTIINAMNGEYRQAQGSLLDKQREIDTLCLIRR